MLLLLYFYPLVSHNGFCYTRFFKYPQIKKSSGVRSGDHAGQRNVPLSNPVIRNSIIWKLRYPAISVEPHHLVATLLLFIRVTENPPINVVTIFSEIKRNVHQLIHHKREGLSAFQNYSSPNIRHDVTIHTIIMKAWFITPQDSSNFSLNLTKNKCKSSV